MDFSEPGDKRDSAKKQILFIAQVTGAQDFLALTSTNVALTNAVEIVLVFAFLADLAIHGDRWQNSVLFIAPGAGEWGQRFFGTDQH